MEELLFFRGVSADFDHQKIHERRRQRSFFLSSAKLLSLQSPDEKCEAPKGITMEENLTGLYNLSYSHDF